MGMKKKQKRKAIYLNCKVARTFNETPKKLGQGRKNAEPQRTFLEQKYELCGFAFIRQYSSILSQKDSKKFQRFNKK